MQGKNNVMRMIKCILYAWVLMAFPVEAQIFDVPYKDDAPTRTLLIPAKDAKAVVLLYPGGGGVLRLKDDGSTANTHTFVRSKDEWTKFGIVAVLVDTPYGLGDGRGHSRSTRDHQQRIKNVISYYKEKFNLPIWLFGHSMGTVSVSEFANGGRDQFQMIDGVIIAGTYRTVAMDGDGKLPVLAMHHAQDGCVSTPISASEAVINARPKDSRAQLILIDGGVSVGDVCGAMAYHGFNQKEDELVKDAAGFILNK